MKFKPLALKRTNISFKKIFAYLVFISFISACSEDPEPIKGVHYRLMPETLNSKDFAPVTEVFSLACGHCRNMEDSIPWLQRKLEQDIPKMHIVFNQSAYVAAMFYYAAEMQTGDIPDYRFMVELFETMQMPQETTQAEQEAAMIAVFESRGLISPINYNDQQLDALSRRVDEVSRLSDKTQIQSVPTFIIKGKYQLITSAHETKEEIADTIEYLLEKK